MSWGNYAAWKDLYIKMSIIIHICAIHTESISTVSTVTSFPVLRIGFMASENMSFENVDGRRMPAYATA